MHAKITESGPVPRKVVTHAKTRGLRVEKQCDMRLPEHSGGWGGSSDPGNVRRGNK